MNRSIVGLRVRLDYFDHGESFSEFMPLSGTITRQCAAVKGPDDWYQVELDSTFAYQQRVGQHYQFKLLNISSVLIRSRWPDMPLSRETSPSVFLLLVADGQKLDCGKFQVGDFLHACWATATVADAA